MNKQQSGIAELGAVEVPAFGLPVSKLLGDKSRQVIQEHKAYSDQFVAEITAGADSRQCAFSLDLSNADEQEVQRVLKGQAEAFYDTQKYRDLRDIYDDVDIVVEQIAGINVEIFTPVNGIAPENANRVIINLHAGGFDFGFGTDTHEEAIPLAALGKIKVISIEYSHMPLHPYPAANNDITKVYKALLNTYEAKHIGFYGSEAGSILAAQAMAHVKQAGLPLPGALGLCGTGAQPTLGGDSVKINAAVTGYSAGQYAYFADADLSDPLVCPLQSDEVLASFPPTLLFSQVRDLGLSSVVYTHQQLVRVGVEADLHVWEGPGGWHLYHPPLAESGEAFRVMARFFDKHLAG